jgi:predicted carbohydrate-binding protein with CBM5 and CBM33 domain
VSEFPSHCAAKDGLFTCTLPADHDGNHVAHGPDGVALHAWSGQPACHAQDGLFTCTLPAGHSGNHVAHGPGGVALLTW